MALNRLMFCSSPYHMLRCIFKALTLCKNQRIISFTMSALSEGVVFGLGNPLLDMSAYVDYEFLKRYNLKPNDAVLADETHANLYKELIEKYQIDYTAGGATQNAIRVAQWMLGKPNAATFMGAIGNDEFGKVMETKAKEDGVNVVYQVDHSTPTGTCGVLITDNGKSRSLCAFLGASQKFTKQHLLANFNWVEKAKVFYISGFHLTVSPESILEIAKHAHNNPGKSFCMNLSAPYISQVFSAPLLQMFPYIDILFGNETEAAAFGQMRGYQTNDIKEIVKLIANEPYNRNDQQRRVIITQGKDNVLLAKTNDTQIQEFETIKLKDEETIDTNSAGDAFAGAFLAQFVQNKPIDVCIKCGNFAACEVIQHSGCTFRKEINFNC